MRSIVTLGVVLLAVTCLAALVVSTEPGALQDLRIAGALVAFAGISLVGIAGPFAWTFARRRGRPTREALPWRRAVFAFAL
ncbi:MAG TPA: hypothetical protein VK116_17780, partial [Planctomycetota bacterium]|nr:hypothetical protein [Planctomycetota bacterium]